MNFLCVVYWSFNPFVVALSDIQMIHYMIIIVTTAKNACLESGDGMKLIKFIWMFLHRNDMPKRFHSREIVPYNLRRNVTIIFTLPFNKRHFSWTLNRNVTAVIESEECLFISDLNVHINLLNTHSRQFARWTLHFILWDTFNHCTKVADLLENEKRVKFYHPERAKPDNFEKSSNG